MNRIEQQEFIRGNKLIAEFMDARIKGSKGAYRYHIMDDDWAEEGLRYHHNWNWLMEVIEKIEKTKHTNDWTFFVRMDRDYTYICKHNDYSGIYAQGDNFTHQGGRTIGTWKAIVEFVERQIEDGVLAVTAKDNVR